MKKMIAAVLAAMLTAGCSNSVVSELMGYLGPESSPDASAAATAAPVNPNQQTAAQNQQTPDPDEPAPSTSPYAEDTSGVEGTVTILADELEIHQYGGKWSVVTGTAKKGETYYCSSVFMDSSGNKWYCVGYNMWIMVNDMKDIDTTVRG